MVKATMIRNAATIKLQGQTGYWVDAALKDVIADYDELKEAGLYPYGLRHSDSGFLITLENQVCTVANMGYAVFAKPVKFRRRKYENEFNKHMDKYFGLNNQYSEVNHDFKEIDLLSLLKDK